MATHNIHGFDLRRWLAKPRGRRQRRLRLIETLALGERRFIGLLAVDGRELLVGATSHSLSLLTELGERDFEDFVQDAEPSSTPGGDLQ
ncbi:MAG: flagellar biosynthetic protein FliO [Terriglobales bacterium]